MRPSLPHSPGSSSTSSSSPKLSEEEDSKMDIKNVKSENLSFYSAGKSNIKEEDRGSESPPLESQAIFKRKVFEIGNRLYYASKKKKDPPSPKKFKVFYESDDSDASESDVKSTDSDSPPFCPLDMNTKKKLYETYLRARYNLEEAIGFSVGDSDDLHYEIFERGMKQEADEGSGERSMNDVEGRRVKVEKDEESGEPRNYHVNVQGIKQEYDSGEDEQYNQYVEGRAIKKEYDNEADEQGNQYVEGRGVKDQDDEESVQQNIQHVKGRNVKDKDDEESVQQNIQHVKGRNVKDKDDEESVRRSIQHVKGRSVNEEDNAVQQSIQYVKGRGVREEVDEESDEQRNYYVEEPDEQNNYDVKKRGVRVEDEQADERSSCEIEEADAKDDDESNEQPSYYVEEPVSNDDEESYGQVNCNVGQTGIIIAETTYETRVKYQYKVNVDPQNPYQTEAEQTQFVQMQQATASCSFSNSPSPLHNAQPSTSRTDGRYSYQYTTPSQTRGSAPSARRRLLDFPIHCHPDYEEWLMNERRRHLRRELVNDMRYLTGELVDPHPRTVPDDNWSSGHPFF